MKVAIITVSDTCSLEASKDVSGPVLKELIKTTQEWTVEITKIVPDDVKQIQNVLMECCKAEMDLILTTGGTGFGQRDVTPEAITPLLTKQAPGFVVAMLSESLKVTPFAMLSRPIAGIINNTIVITLPGSPKGAKENLLAVLPSLGHALELVRGGKGEATHSAMQKSVNGTVSTSTAIPTTSHSHSCPHKSYPLDKPQAKRPRESTFDMLSVQAAHDLILSHSKSLGTESRKVDESLVGYISAQDVVAKEQVPAFRASIVDGYAMNSQDGPGVYPLCSSVVAGVSEPFTLASKQVARVNTGAPVPNGCDAVVMVEYTTVKQSSPDGKREELIEIYDPVKPGDNVREVGSDCAMGTTVLQKGEAITLVGGEIGILASVGTSSLEVYKKPKVGVLSTGSEVVDNQDSLKLGQVRDSNRPTLLAALKSCGFEAIDFGIVSDDVELITNRLKQALASCDVIITTGGVSMGELDLIKPIIEQRLNGQIHFGRVNMKPGKPTTFASLGDKLVYALPGNPVSAIVSFYVFVLPGLRQMSGYKEVFPSTVQVAMPQVYKLDHRNEYVRAIVGWKDGKMVANITGNQRSSRMLSMKGANALLMLPAATEGKKQLLAGEMVEAMVIGSF